MQDIEQTSVPRMFDLGATVLNRLRLYASVYDLWRQYGYWSGALLPSWDCPANANQQN